MGKIIEMKAAEIVLDYNLYPRHKIDGTHVLHIRSALRAGEELPPVVVDKSSRRATDGFHRITAALKEFGDDATIKALVKDYGSEGEMFEDAISMNSGHGSNLTPFDRVRCITLAEEFKIDLDSLAVALRMPAEEIQKLQITRTAKSRTSPGLTPIKQGLGHLAGRKLTKKQEEGNESYGGLKPLFYVNQVILCIEKDLIDTSNTNLLAGMATLRDLLNGLDLEIRESA
jgi:hypothetical protein